MAPSISEDSDDLSELEQELEEQDAGEDESGRNEDSDEEDASDGYSNLVDEEADEGIEAVQNARISIASEVIESEEGTPIPDGGDVSMQDAETDDESAEANDVDEVGRGAYVKSEDEITTEAMGDSESTTDGEEDEEVSPDSGSEANETPADVEQANCMFCKRPEDEDPSEEFEPYLTCAQCGLHSHQQCAKENGAWKENNEGATNWYCSSCGQSKINSESPKEMSARSRNSAPRLVRDLLPVSRGIQRPDAHSIFAQPLISEGEDGGRALRKRKSPTGEPVPVEKRRRKETPRISSNVPATPVAEDKMEDLRAVAHSTRRASQKALPAVRILQHRPFDKPPPHKFILALRLEQDRIAQILSKPPKPGKKRDRRRPPKLPPPPIFHAPVPKFPALPTNNLIFPSFLSERENEMSSKPYGGVLSESDADTSRALPQFRDREIFEIARKEAEEERRRTSAAAEAEIGGETTASSSKPSRTVSGPPSKIKCIQFGKFVIDTFYAAPYPEEYSHESRLFICEFCLKYLPSEFVAWRHKLKCPAKHPPGDEIYREGSISIWEVDGRKKTEYCQCLCLMAKMFLGSKTLYYDVEPFLFYILTEYDEFGYHFVGYFSKEKRPASMNNVSCILVMPIHQRKGYATFLIDFSYLLSRIEGKEGSPEKPLSDMGLTAYRSYWDLTISRHLLDLGLKPFSTKTLMERTGMTADDVVHSLERLYAFIRDPVTKTYGIRYDRKLYENIVNDFDSKKHRKLRPEMLVWTPYVMGRSDQATLDGQPLQTVAPREGDEEEEEVEETQGSAQAVDGQPDELDEPDVGLSPEKARRSRSRSARIASRQASAQPEVDKAPVNANGVVAPGPPSTAGLSKPISAELSHIDTATSGLVNGTDQFSGTNVEEQEALSGYALAFRVHNIPPSRFQIDPPIPPSMLRHRSTKKRTHVGAQQSLPNGLRSGNETPVAAVPIRSSPRHVNGNGLATGKGILSPEKQSNGQPGTPIRRSGRRSGLANEVAALEALDGSMDENDEEGDEEEGDEKEESGVDEQEDRRSSSGEEEDDDGEEEDDDGEEEASAAAVETDEDDVDIDEASEAAVDEDEESEDDDDDEDDEAGDGDDEDLEIEAAEDEEDDEAESEDE